MRSYELMVIHRYDMAEPDVRDAVAEIEKAITDRDGNVKETDSLHPSIGRLLCQSIIHASFSTGRYRRSQSTFDILARANSSECVPSRPWPWA